jgi:hypothetical protein
MYILVVWCESILASLSDEIPTVSGAALFSVRRSGGAISVFCGRYDTTEAF